MKIRALHIIVGILCFASLSARAQVQWPGDASITYQGRLSLNGVAVNEDCDVVFSLYDAATGGQLIAQVGSAAAPRVVQVQKGLFTQPLDFGMNAFSGGERWIEIAVRPAGSGLPFSVLSPRQRVTATPYALHALSGGDGSSLDQAYNKGGPGAGRTVHANNGPMSIDGDGGLLISGNVGIGTQNPNSKLEVAGVVHSTTGGFMFPDGTIQSTAAGAGSDPRVTSGCTDAPDGTPVDVLCVDNDGNVTVGYNGTPPAAPFDLDVKGNIRATQDVYAENTIGVGTVSPSDDITISTPTGPDFLTLGFEVDPTGSGSGSGIIGFRTGPGFTGDDLANIEVDYTGTPADAILDINSGVPNDVRLVTGGGKVGIATTPTNRLSVDGDADFTGNVGIGVATPVERLHIDGTLRIDGVVGTDGIIFPDGTTQTTASTAGGDITAVNTPAGSGLTGGATSGDVTLQVDFTPAGGINGTATTVARGDHTHNDIGGGAITVDGSGNVGIGTPPNPAFKLDVGGNIHTAGTISAGAFASNSPFIAEAPAGTPRLRIDDTNGFVSIGSPPTAAPAELLDVDGNVQANQFISLEAVNPPFVVNSSALVVGLNADQLDGTDSTGFALLAGRPGGQTLNGGTMAGDPLSLNGSTTNDGNILMNVAGGNVGIGTATPTVKLDVTGNAHVTGDADVDGKVITDFVNAQSPLQLQTDGITRVYIAGMPDPNPGFVGIDTLTPEVRLHVTNGTEATAATGGFEQLGLSAGPNVALDNDEIQARNAGVASTLNLNADGGNVVIGGTVAGGNLGIGNASPFWSIDVLDSQAVARLISLTGTFGSVVELRNNAGAPLFLGAINFNDAVDSVPGQIAYRFDNQLVFSVNHAESMRIDQNGNVGIGTPTPNEKLHVIGDAQIDGAVYTSEVSSRTGALPVQLQLNDDPVVHVDPNGNVGIGPPAMGGPPIPPDEALHVNGCIKADCLKITADSILEISPLTMVRSGTGVEVQPGPTGTVKIHPLAVGVQNVMIPISLHNTTFGVQNKLKSLEISYKVSSPTTFITASRFRLMRNAGVFDNLIDDGTDRKNTSWTTFTVTPPAGIPPNVFPPLDGPAFIHLELIIGGTSPSYDIEIGRIKVTLTEEV